jgi:hypothetical protein
MFPTTLRMVHGNSWGTLCREGESRFFYAFTTPSTTIQRLLNLPICRWDGMPNERSRAILGLGNHTSQTSWPPMRSKNIWVPQKRGCR